MRLTRYHLALIPPTVLCLASCSVSRNLSQQTQTKEEIRVLSEKVGSLEQSLLSVRAEIRQLNIDTSRLEDRSEVAEVETVSETFDTDKPTDPVTGTPPLKSRETRRMGTRATATVKSSAQIISNEKTEIRDSIRTVVDSLQTETVESTAKSEVDIREETPALKKGLTWLQKTLIYCGAGAIILGIVKVLIKYYKPRSNGVLTLFKKLLNNITKWEIM